MFAPDNSLVTNDHIHIVCLLSRDVTVSNLVEETKRNSSRWIKTLSPTVPGIT
ncbi:MAG: transposase [Bacteroidaceae bacterium]|nr:transposase [Bacteroidaceae bacterium]